MKKQYTSMQQELAARKAAGGNKPDTNRRPVGGNKPDANRRAAGKRRGFWDHVKLTAGRQPVTDRRRPSAESAAAVATEPVTAAAAPAPVPDTPQKTRDQKTARPRAAVVLGALIFLGFLLPGLVLMDNVDNWDSEYDWSAASDYGIDETSDDSDVMEYILDYTDYAPADDEVDTDALQQWIGSSRDLLEDAPGSWEAAAQENRIIIRAEYDPDTDDTQDILAYWENAYSSIYDSLETAGLEYVPVAVIIRDSQARDLYGILIDESVCYSTEDY